MDIGRISSIKVSLSCEFQISTEICKCLFSRRTSVIQDEDVANDDSFHFQYLFVPSRAIFFTLKTVK